MDNIGIFFDYIGRTNLFNFAIFLSIIVFVAKKINVNGILEKSKSDIAKTIEDSDKVRVTAEADLKNMEEVYAKVEDEVVDLIQKSEESAKLVGEKVLAETNKTIENIKNNSIKLVENKVALTKNEIMKRTSIAAVEVAKNHIINELNNNYDLHNRLIDESIKALEGVEL